MSKIMDVYNMLDDGKRVWNGYLAAVIDYKPAQIFHSLVMKYKYYEEHMDELKNRDYEDYTMLAQGWFYCTIDDLYKSTCMKYKSQTAAIKKLIDLHLIEVKKYGLFNRRYFRIVAEGLKSLIEKGKEIVKKASKKFAILGNISSDEPENDSSDTQREVLPTHPIDEADEVYTEYPEVYTMLKKTFKDKQIKQFIKQVKDKGVNGNDVYAFIKRCCDKSFTNGRIIPNKLAYLKKVIENEPISDNYEQQSNKRTHHYDGEAIKAELLAQFRD